MHYMLAFNPKEKIILYWDEPTISMDYETHEFHQIIKMNWVNNLIPNIVLSSATLPHLEDITDTIQDFKTRFNDAEIYNIESHDFKKTIPLINKEGYVEMPHYMFNDYLSIKKSAMHCEKYKTLLRYIDLGEAIKFIMYINNNADEFINTNRYGINNYFTSIESVNMENIKTYYLTLLKNIKPECWSKIFKYMISERQPRQISNIHIVSNDAHTLTDGPTIFLTNDTDKVSKFCIQSANIPPDVFEDIKNIIKFLK